jgi:hypothetical protein
VSVGEKEERSRETQRDSVPEFDRVGGCVCVCVCEGRETKISGGDGNVAAVETLMRLLV